MRLRIELSFLAIAALGCNVTFAQNASIEAQMDAAKAAFNNVPTSNDLLRSVVKETRPLEKRADSCVESHQYAAAETLYKRELLIAEKLGPAHLLVAVSLDNLALVYALEKKYDEAEKFANRALLIWNDAKVPISIEGVPLNDITMTLNNLGVYLMNGARYLEAEKVLAEAVRLDPSYSLPSDNLEIVRKKLGKN